MSLRSQLLKGVLEGCIMAIVEKETVYGYELSQKLQYYGLNGVSEGSIYPILLRLQKEGLVTGEIRKSPMGPKRKYYQLTDKGRDALREFAHEWRKLQVPVENMLKGRLDDER